MAREIQTYKILPLTIFISLVLASCTVGYENDGKKVTWHTWNEGNGHNSRTVDADPQTFEELNDDYGRDKTHAFFRGDIIKGAEGGSFRVLKDWYASDNNHVFLSGELVENAAPATFKVHTYYFAEDTNDYFWKGKRLNVSDKQSFKLLGDADDWKTSWVKDRNNGYYLNGSIIPNIDYSSFHQIDIGTKQRGLSGCYAADNKRVFFMEKEVPGADPATFREVDFYIGQDKNRAYKGAVPTQIRDYTKLKNLGGMYSDGINIYDYDFHILPNADVKSFEQIERNWYKDKYHVWWDNKMLVGANPKTFIPVPVSSYRYGKKKALSSGDFNYGKDDIHVFCQDSIIPGADAASFEKIDFPDGDSWTVFDRNRVYQGKDSPKLREYLKKKYGK